MGEEWPFWLFFLLIFAVGLHWGSKYVVDTANIVALSIEVRSVTQNAASAAFSAIDMEGIGEREVISDQAHRYLVLDKAQAQVKFLAALKTNFNLDDQYKAIDNKHLDSSRPVLIKSLQLIDSTDLPAQYNGETYTEPTIIVDLILPVRFYSTKKDTLEVIRIIPIRTFITNWQR